MNWFEFDLFLLRQLDNFRLSQSSKNFELDDPFEENIASELFSNYESRSPMSIPTDRTFDSLDPGRSINWKGAGEMYVTAGS